MTKTKRIEEIKKLLKTQHKLSTQDIADRYLVSLKTGQNYINAIKKELAIIKDTNGKYFIKNTHSEKYEKLKKIINNYIQIEINSTLKEIKLQDVGIKNNIEYIKDYNNKFHNITKITDIKRIKKESLINVEILLFKGSLVDKLKQDPILISQTFIKQNDGTFILSGETLNIKKIKMEVDYYFPNMIIASPKVDITKEYQQIQEIMNSIEGMGIDL